MATCCSMMPTVFYTCRTPANCVCYRYAKNPSKPQKLSLSHMASFCSTRESSNGYESERELSPMYAPADVMPTVSCKCHDRDHQNSTRPVYAIAHMNDTRCTIKVAGRNSQERAVHEPATPRILHSIDQECDHEPSTPPKYAPPRVITAPATLDAFKGSIRLDIDKGNECQRRHSTPHWAEYTFNVPIEMYKPRWIVITSVEGLTTNSWTRSVAGMTHFEAKLLVDTDGHVRKCLCNANTYVEIFAPVRTFVCVCVFCEFSSRSRTNFCEQGIENEINTLYCTQDIRRDVSYKLKK